MTSLHTLAVLYTVCCKVWLKVLYYFTEWAICACNSVKFETGRNLPPVIKIATCTAQVYFHIQLLIAIQYGKTEGEGLLAFFKEMLSVSIWSRSGLKMSLRSSIAVSVQALESQMFTKWKTYCSIFRIKYMCILF